MENAPESHEQGKKLFIIKLVTTEERMRELARAVGYVRKRGGRNPRRPVNKMVELEMGVTEDMMVAMANDFGFISRAIVEKVIQEGAAKIAQLKLPIDLPQALLRCERRYLVEALRQTKGNKAQAAALLGLKRTTVVEKIKRFAIAPSEYGR